ncbi:MAG: 23S rRNA (pseudouridine(1915)-N(3))-methyltransferase RlmH [Clostridiales bacterium]
MRITIIALGKLKEKYLQDGIQEYLKRLTPWAKMEIIQLADEKIPNNGSQGEIEKIKEKEGQRILASLPANCYHIALDIKGENLASEALAAKIADLTVNGYSHLVFSIGGSLGLSPQVTESADFLLSFGKMTFPHQLMRLILAEQIYRVFKINRGESYHK